MNNKINLLLAVGMIFIITFIVGAFWINSKESVSQTQLASPVSTSEAQLPTQPGANQPLSNQLAPPKDWKLYETEVYEIKYPGNIFNNSVPNSGNYYEPLSVTSVPFIVDSKTGAITGAELYARAYIYNRNEFDNDNYEKEIDGALNKGVSEVGYSEKSRGDITFLDFPAQIYQGTSNTSDYKGLVFTAYDKVINIYIRNTKGDNDFPKILDNILSTFKLKIIEEYNDLSVKYKFKYKTLQEAVSTFQKRENFDRILQLRIERNYGNGDPRLIILGVVDFFNNKCIVGNLNLVTGKGEFSPTYCYWDSSIPP